MSPRKRITIDMDQLMVTLLSTAYASSEEYPTSPVEVRAEPDVDSDAVTPLVIVTAGQGQMVSNGGPLLAWTWQVHISILHHDEEGAADLADHTYEVMHGFHDDAAGFPDIGTIVSVEDVSMPSRTATMLTPAGGLTQFDGTWTVTAQKN